MDWKPNVSRPSDDSAGCSRKDLQNGSSMIHFMVRSEDTHRSKRIAVIYTSELDTDISVRYSAKSIKIAARAWKSSKKKLNIQDWQWNAEGVAAAKL